METYKQSAYYSKLLAHAVCNCLRANSCLSEFDAQINDLSYELVNAMRRENTEIWGCQLNDGSPDVCKLGETVHTFGADYVLPCYDKALAVMVKAWRDSGAVEWLDRIADRVRILGGYQLTWV